MDTATDVLQNLKAARDDLNKAIDNLGTMQAGVLLERANGYIDNAYDCIYEDDDYSTREAARIMDYTGGQINGLCWNIGDGGELSGVGAFEQGMATQQALDALDVRIEEWEQICDTSTEETLGNLFG